MKFIPNLKTANELLRAGNWLQAIEHYEILWDIWQDEPSLRRIIQQNIKYLQKNNPSFFLDIKDKFNKNLFSYPDAIEISDKSVNTSSVGCASLKPIEINTNLQNALKDIFEIEQIYAVNLERRPDRYIRLIREFNHQELPVFKITGIDGKNSEKAIENYLNFCNRDISKRCITSKHISDAKINSYKKIASAGWFAYLLSQRLVFEDAVKNGYRRILVVDDDVFFSTNAISQLNGLHGKIPSDLKVFLLGASEYANRNSEEFLKSVVPDINGVYKPISGKTCGSFAVVYDCSVFLDVLHAIDEADGPYDNVALGYIYNKFPGSCFSFSSAICIPDVGDSDIRPNKRAQSDHSKKMLWEYERYAEYTKEFRISILVDSENAIRHVQTLQHELPSQIFLNLYFLSEDGLRPIITGHKSEFSAFGFLPFNALNGEQLLGIIEKYRVPYSDLILNWSGDIVTEEKALKIASSILQLKNATKKSYGIIDGVTYALDAGVIPVKGRHSIIIPSYRSIDDIWPTVKSALMQDAREFEVVVVNDNPLNLTFVEELKEKISNSFNANDLINFFEKIKIISHSLNRNASAARNTGYLSSTGEFITFLDDDDTFDVNRLSGIESLLNSSSKEVGACYCGYRGKWNGEKNLNRFPEGDLMEQVLALRYEEH